MRKTTVFLCKCFLILILVTVITIPAFSQEIRFDHFSVKEGLSQGNILEIHQDKFTFLWIGTEDGLNLVDGARITVFKNNPHDSTSISNNNIFSLTEDTIGNIWVGTQIGLNYFNREMNRFQQFLNDPNDQESLSNNAVRAVYMDSNSNLWVGTANGLNLYDPKENKFKRFIHDPNDAASLANNEIRFIIEDHSGQLWIATYGGISALSQDYKSFKNYSNSPDDPASLSSNSTMCLFEDSNFNLWVGTLDGGLNKMSKRDGKFVRFAYSTNDPTSIASQYIHEIGESKDKELWVATDGGLCRFDNKSGKFKRYITDVDDETSISSSISTEVFFDINGRMLVGTRYGGVNIYDKEMYWFRHFKHKSNNATSLSANAVNSFAEDESGNIWIGVDGGGLNYYDRATGQFTHFINQPGNKNSVTNNKVLCVKVDKRGGQWLGYWSGGLSYRDKKTKTFKHYTHTPGNKNGLSSNNILNILEDSRENIWFATTLGICRYSEDTFTQYLHDNNNPNSIAGDNIVGLIEDHLGKIWIATRQNGLDMLDPKTEIFTHYKYGKNEGDLSDDAIFSLYEDSKHRLWVGTNGGGLNLFDRDTKKFKVYRQSDGLPNNVIMGILEDDDENLWLSTNKGISRFNPDSLTFKNYDEGDGLQGNQFIRWAFHRLSTGEMLFGGVNGFNLFDPAKIKSNQYVPPVFITDFKLFNRPVAIGENEVLKKSMLFTKEIRLKYSENFFSFEFAALNFKQSEKNRYRYIMEGFQEEWIDVGTENKVSYTNIDPGEYTFKVMGANNDGVWNKAGAAVRIIITPPYWQTWWFRAISVLFVVGSILSYYVFRINSINSQKRELERQVQERTNQLSLQAEHLSNAYSEIKLSICAALEIQNSILPSENFVKKYFPDSFIFYKPKDVVSGDFYWFDIKGDCIIIAVVDCIGHGVSGALMTITGHHLLNKAVARSGNLIASEILNRLNEDIISELHQNAPNIQFGMDVSLCVFNQFKSKLQFAGANQALYIVRDASLIQIKPNNFSIGPDIKGRIHNFSNNEIDLIKGDNVYLFTDGFADQFGGEDGTKKFLYSKFRELLVNVEKETMENQNLLIEKKLSAWKGNIDQVDDILVIGLKI